MVALLLGWKSVRILIYQLRFCGCDCICQILVTGDSTSPASFHLGVTPSDHPPTPPAITVSFLLCLTCFIFLYIIYHF